MPAEERKPPGVGKVVHRSRRLYVAESQLTDSDGTEIARGSGTSPARLWRVPNQPYGADTPLLPGGAWGSCGDSSRRLPWSPATSPSRRKSAARRWTVVRRPSALLKNQSLDLIRQRPYHSEQVRPGRRPCLEAQRKVVLQ